MKRCQKCGRTLSREAFSRLASSKDGLQGRCRECVSAYNRTDHAKGLQRAKRLSPEWKASQWRARLKHAYGITPEQWEELFARQAGKCPGCATLLGRGITTHVDHCHSTGEVRGLLCRKCNLAIGHAADRPDVLRNLLKYLTGD